MGKNASRLVAWLLFQLFWLTFSTIWIGGKLLPRQEGEKKTYVYKHNTHKIFMVLEKRQSWQKILLIICYICNFKEINCSFYFHPFYLPMKSNAQSNFLKAFVSFFKEEEGNL